MGQGDKHRCDRLAARLLPKETTCAAVNSLTDKPLLARVSCGGRHAQRGEDFYGTGRLPAGGENSALDHDNLQG